MTPSVPETKVPEKTPTVKPIFDPTKQPVPVNTKKAEPSEVHMSQGYPIKKPVKKVPAAAPKS
jgi:hypothetical protein